MQTLLYVRTKLMICDIKMVSVQHSWLHGVPLLLFSLAPWLVGHLCLQTFISVSNGAFPLQRGAVQGPFWVAFPLSVVPASGYYFTVFWPHKIEVLSGPTTRLSRAESG